jgi:hypothetical protein
VNWEKTTSSKIKNLLRNREKQGLVKSANSKAFSQTFSGYLAGCHQGLDRGFDGENLGGNDVGFLLIPDSNLTIQGRITI